MGVPGGKELRQAIVPLVVLEAREEPNSVSEESERGHLRDQEVRGADLFDEGAHGIIVDAAGSPSIFPLSLRIEGYRILFLMKFSYPPPDRSKGSWEEGDRIIEKDFSSGP